MDNRVSKLNVTRQTMYGFSSSLAVALQMTYITIFMTDGLLIPAAVMGTVLLAGRVIDFIIAVIAGGLIERIKMPWGKYRSWLLVFRWVILAGNILIFVNTANLALPIRLGIVLIGYVLMNASMTFLSTAQFGSLATMSGTNMDDRNLIARRYAQGLAAGGIVTAMAIIPLLTYFGEVIGPTNAYLLVAVAFTLPFFLGIGSLAKGVKEYEIGEKAIVAPPGPKVTVKDMIQSVVTNSQLVVLIIVFSCVYTGMFLLNGVMAYYFTYVLGDFMLMTITLTVNTLFGFIASVFIPRIGLKLGKKRAMVVGLGIYGIMSCMITFFAAESFPIYIAISVVNIMAMYLFNSFGVNYMLDAGEYGFYTTKKDNRAVAMSMFNLPIKIGLALGGAIGAFGLAWAGYEVGAEISPDFISKFMIILGIAPGAIALFGAVVMFFGYKISDEDAAMYAAENAKAMGMPIPGAPEGPDVPGEEETVVVTQ
ncbi:MFS transporter [Eubacteriaceae bacterium ES3]|nr:MFS transporter [Eubacteriaceae bacterium ES3]